MPAPLELPNAALDERTPLAWAHPIVAEWFLTRFGSATEPQIEGWPAIVARETTLISAPTGSGKTLTAFLVAIDSLLRQAIEGALSPATQVVYVSPLKALSNDIQKNLEGPLHEIQQLAVARGYLCPEIRTGVRTGDTLPAERARMLRNPPHILVTTPESLYLLLTAAKSRENLRQVRTVIVDEIHALADDKRGAHLALSLERLDALVCGENRLSPGSFVTGRAEPPQRIGLSATQNPIQLVGEFLAGSHPRRGPARIIQVGQRRRLDLAIEIPRREDGSAFELSSVCSTAMWESIYDRIAQLAGEHRSTLVFVNTRRLVEKLAFELSGRLAPEQVAAHHGSLSRELRLDAEQRLKAGEIRVLIATASLELGIDIGHVDLVCQIASTRAVAVAMQRVGRAGHWRDATPKARLFAATRDDLLEQAALVRSMRAGRLDILEIPPEPVDVLMQQITAAVAAEPWEEDALYQVVRRAMPFRELTRSRFHAVVELLSHGIEASRGRYGAYLLRDGINRQLHPRRGARAIAIANGGAIPDTALYSVVLQPENVQIATLDEHFAVDSGPGDVIQLGNTSWRIQRVDPAGRVLVEDAHGAPPTVPFWFGEAPQRTSVLSDGVSELREEIAARTAGLHPASIHTVLPEVAACMAWLMQECAVCESAALQLVTYIVMGRAVLGAVPSKTTLIAERFFDEGGGMQLILHAPFGGRINRGWGLALRKRFCRGFNFELQAAATDNGINIALAEQHSFPLADVFHFLTEHTAKELLEQAAIAAPVFKTRWRWAAGRSLQLLRMSKGKRIAPQVQRTRAEDLLASVFPQAAACFENIEGDIQIPAHPLIDEVMRDVLQEAMDLAGLNTVLRQIADGSIRCIAVDTPVPSVFAHELINANVYAFLDEAGLEERRARAVSLRRTIPDSVLESAGRLDARAIEQVRQEIFPDIRDHHEMHDILHSLVVLPEKFLAEDESQRGKCKHWLHYLTRLTEAGRALRLVIVGQYVWLATERLADVGALWPGDRDTWAITVSNLCATTTLSSKEDAALKLLQGWMQMLGPTTCHSLGKRLEVDPSTLYTASLAMEMQGLLIRGAFEQPSPPDDEPYEIEWCERRILQRIHRLTVSAARRQIEPVSPAIFMGWLLEWQHLAPQTQLTGEDGVLAALEQLEGFEAPAVEWERTLLPARVAHYDPRWLDQLCLSGAVGWGRISPHPAWHSGGEDSGRPRRVVPTNAAPITFYLRETADWLPHALTQHSVDERLLAEALSPDALSVRETLTNRGACFLSDLQRTLGITAQQTARALWELATAGIAAADGFDQLRALMDPRRKPRTVETGTRRSARTSAGRWSLLSDQMGLADPATSSPVSEARRHDQAIESYARMLLARYGVLFRDLLARESNAPRWRDLLGILRRLEARGEVRGGRFVSGFSGEQFALSEAADSLRQSRDRQQNIVIDVAGADPMNLAGIVVPGDKIPAVPGRTVRYLRGLVHVEGSEEPQHAAEQVIPELAVLGLARAASEPPLFEGGA